VNIFVKSRFILYIVLFAILLFPTDRGVGAVTLKYFEVSWDAATQQVKLRWETASELDNLGFQVRRKVSGSGGVFEVVRLCAKSSGCTESEKVDFVSAESTIVGKLYGDYYDGDVQRGVSYTYQLIAVDTNQNSEVAETKTVTVPPSTGTTQPTSTTAAPTSTPGQNVPRRTPTAVIPTNTVRVISPTPLPQPTATMDVATETSEPTPTTTEQSIPTLPLPSITLIFPDTPTPFIEVASETPLVGTVPQNASWFTPSRLLVIGMIVFVWVILGGGFIFALRKIE